MPPPQKALFSFGIISDVQYADIPDGLSFNGIPRYYRSTLACLRSAVEGWQGAGVDFAIHLGDIVDGFNPPDLAEGALDRVIQEFDALNRPHYHMIGNHELYNIPRPVLNTKLRMGGKDTSSYYSFTPHKGWRFVVLDGYDCSILGWPPGHPLHEKAVAILDERNPNKDKNNPTRPASMDQKERRFVKFGGGFGDKQLEWLKMELQACRQQKQRAIIFCHLGLKPGTCPNACLAWNYEDALAIIHDFKDVCVASFSGHAHSDGSVVDNDGVLFRVFKAVVETPAGEPCSGIVHITSDSLQLVGDGIDSEHLNLQEK